MSEYEDLQKLSEEEKIAEMKRLSADQVKPAKTIAELDMGHLEKVIRKNPKIRKLYQTLYGKK